MIISKPRYTALPGRTLVSAPDWGHYKNTTSRHMAKTLTAKGRHYVAVDGMRRGGLPRRSSNLA